MHVCCCKNGFAAASVLFAQVKFCSSATLELSGSYRQWHSVFTPQRSKTGCVGHNRLARFHRSVGGATAVTAKNRERRKYIQAQKLSNFLKQCTDVRGLIEIHTQDLYKSMAHSLVYLQSKSSQFCACARPHREHVECTVCVKLITLATTVYERHK